MIEESPGLGDRLAGFSVLLPAEPAGTVVVVASPAVASALQHRFSGAVAVGAETVLPPRGTVALLVLDTRVAAAQLQPPEVWRRLLTAEGTVATIGARGDFAIYPGTELPQHVWRPGWPLPDVVGLRAQLRRNGGIWTRGMRGVPHLELSGAMPESLAERIGAELGRLTGGVFQLVGITTAGHTILRYRSHDRPDLAVRLSCTDTAERVTVLPPAMAEVPGLTELVPVEIGRGCTHGHSWAASRWLPTRRTPLVHSWGSARQSWSVLETLAETLGAVTTGRTTPGWAERWLARVPLLPEATRERLTPLLCTLDAGLPTGWCHGDPWPANVLLENGRGVVIDWDNAADDAPLGLDRLLIAALRLTGPGRLTMAQACVRLAADGTFTGRIAGAPWDAWDPRTRAALSLAAYLLHLANRSMHELGAAQLAADLDTITGLLALANPVGGRSR